MVNDLKDKIDAEFKKTLKGTVEALKSIRAELEELQKMIRKWVGGKPARKPKKATPKKKRTTAKKSVNPLSKG